MGLKLNDVSSKNFTNINMSLGEKEISVIIGSNESNKENLIEIICGKEKIETGKITYNEKEFDLNLDKKLIYHLPVNYNSMLFNLNIKEDIKYYLGKYDTEKLNELLKQFSLPMNILDKNYLDLSSSEIKKVLIVIGLLSSCKIIVLENPTDKLDTKAIDTLIKQLKQLKRDGRIILITSYNANFLLGIADKIFAIEGTKIIKEGTKYEILQDEKLLKKVDVKMPNIVKLIKLAKEAKNIKLKNRDNINDLLKEIYRHAN